MMKPFSTPVQKIAPAFGVALLAVCAAGTRLPAQMHKVEAPDTVTRAVGVYEYVGDPLHPRAARLIPVSLFIGGHFEDAGIYLARPVPFALGSGFRYELQHAGVMQDYLDLVASRNFAGSSAAANLSFEDGWFGYGRVTPPAAPKSAKLRPNCGNAHVVRETDNSKQDDGKPHFGTKPADSTTKPAQTSNARRGQPAPDPCRDEDKPEKVTLADDTPKDKNAPDPERPTLHRSPETSANNTSANGKDTRQDKKAPKPPPATVTANSSPADDPDRPRIRHRTTDEDDPNSLPPDPIELKAADAEKAEKAAAKPALATAKNDAAANTGMGNNTVTADATVDSGATMTGGPHLQRGHVSAPPPDAKPAAVHSATTTVASTLPAASALPAPLDSLVAVSDAKDRPTHDFTYKFASSTEHAAAVSALESMAQAVLADPSLATDAPEGVKAAAAKAKAASAKPAATTHTAAAAHTTAAATHATAHTATAAHSTAAARAKAKAAAAAPALPVLVDEEVTAYQLYYSAPVTYVMTARVAATDAAPERFITVIATTDADGKLHPAMRSITDAMHLDRTPRYRLIDVVDADGSNRASLLMELRSQHSRQFALYRLLGNKPDQAFITGSTLL